MYSAMMARLQEERSGSLSELYICKQNFLTFLLFTDYL